MLKKVILYGLGPVSEAIFFATRQHDEFEVVCFTVDRPYKQADILHGLPIVEFEKIAQLYPPSVFQMLVVNTGSRSVLSRKVMFEKAKEKGYSFINYIDSRADVSPDLEMKENNIILANAHVGSNSKMGSNNLIRQNVYLGHDACLKDHVVLGPGCNVAGLSTIHDLCFIGIGATVIQQIVLERETFIGAGSLVLRNTEECSKYIGVPAKKVEDISKNGGV